MTKPVIGITTCHAAEEWITRHTQLYLDAVRAAGGELLVLAPETHTPDSANAVVSTIDALLLSGGGDIDPREYAAAPDGSEEIDPARDALEFALARAALARNIPVLGVCRGFQVLNVVFGGKLAQHVPGHRGAPLLAGNHANAPHEVELAGDGRLIAVFGTGPAMVNSYHHQAVTHATLASGLLAGARTGDMVEAFESPAHRWVLAVQWHPERYVLDRETLSSPEAHARLFDKFVRVAVAP